MKISIPKDAVCGTVMIPLGDYWVSLQSETGEINLTGHGRDIRIKATRRRVKANSKITTVQFYNGGGKQLSLVVSTPKFGEWVSFLEYV